MSQRVPSPLQQVQRFLNSNGTVSLALVRTWMLDEDEEVLGGAYEALSRHPERIQPIPDPTMLIDLLIRIIEVGKVRPGPRELSLSPYDAGACIVELASSWASDIRGGGPGGTMLLSLRDRLAAAYGAGDQNFRRRLVHAFLEHAFENPAIRGLFAEWQTSPVLSAAFAEAAAWADNQK